MEIVERGPSRVLLIIDAHEAETGDPQSDFGTFPPGWEFHVADVVGFASRPPQPGL